MKKLICMTFLLTGLSLSAQVATQTTLPENTTARKTESADVPDLIVEKFNARVKNITPSWTNEGNSYMAAYKDSLDLGHIITYDQKGNVITMQDQQGRTAYPPPIESYYEKRFPNEPFNVWLSTDPDGNRMYYFTHDKQTIWFDPKGNVVERSANKKVKNP